jgi:hypothetical protein
MIVAAKVHGVTSHKTVLLTLHVLKTTDDVLLLNESLHAYVLFALCSVVMLKISEPLFVYFSSS